MGVLSGVGWKLSISPEDLHRVLLIVSLLYNSGPIQSKLNDLHEVFSTAK